MSKGTTEISLITARKNLDEMNLRPAYGGSATTFGTVFQGSSANPSCWVCWLSDPLDSRLVYPARLAFLGSAQFG